MQRMLHRSPDICNCRVLCRRANVTSKQAHGFAIVNLPVQGSPESPWRTPTPARCSCRGQGGPVSSPGFLHGSFKHSAGSPAPISRQPWRTENNQTLGVTPGKGRGGFQESSIATFTIRLCNSLQFQFLIHAIPSFIQFCFSDSGPRGGLQSMKRIRARRGAASPGQPCCAAPHATKLMHSSVASTDCPAVTRPTQGAKLGSSASPGLDRRQHPRPLAAVTDVVPLAIPRCGPVDDCHAASDLRSPACVHAHMRCAERV